MADDRTFPVPRGTTIHCNCCNRELVLLTPMERKPFAGQRSSRLTTALPCSYCNRTDWHYVNAIDVMPSILTEQWLEDN